MARFRFAAPVLFLSALAVLAASAPGNAQQAALNVSVKDHQFQPQQITARANVAFSLRVRNRDAGRMEFESENPKVEKVIGGNSEAVFKLGPLAPGHYEFYDDFDQRSTLTLVVR